MYWTNKLPEKKYAGRKENLPLNPYFCHPQSGGVAQAVRAQDS